jgi:acetyl esterase/lipase
MLVWAESDLACFSLSARMLRDRLREGGVPVTTLELPAKDHVDYVFQFGSPKDTLLPELVAFVQAPPPPAVVPLRAAGECEDDFVLGTAGARCELVKPLGKEALASIVWLVADAAEVAPGKALAAKLAPFGIAFLLIAIDAQADEPVAAVWQELRGQAAGRRVPAPAFLGGFGRGGVLAANAPLAAIDGLRGRVVAGAALGAQSLPVAWPGHAVPDVVGCLSRGAGRRPSLLLLQAELDPEAQRHEALAVCAQLMQRGVEVHPVELAAMTTRDALGSSDELVLAMLRAFLVP